jgi:hypothetical protein
MEGSIGSIPSRNNEPTLSSHLPTRSIAVRGSNRDQGTLEGGSSSNKKMTKGISTKREEHVSSWGEKKLTLTKGCKRTSRGGARERAEAAGNKNDRRKELVTAVYRENLNIGRPKFNYSHVIHLTSESIMWIVKRSRFDEIFASAVSDRPSEQRFKKSNFWSTPETLSIFFWCYILPPPPKKNSSSNSAASTKEPKEDWWNMYNNEFSSLKKIGVLVAHCRLQFPCSFSLRLITP